MTLEELQRYDGGKLVFMIPVDVDGIVPGHGRVPSILLKSTAELEIRSSSIRLTRLQNLLPQGWSLLEWTHQFLEPIPNLKKHLKLYIPDELREKFLCESGIPTVPAGDIDTSRIYPSGAFHRQGDSRAEFDRYIDSLIQQGSLDDQTG